MYFYLKFSVDDKLFPRDKKLISKKILKFDS